MEKLELKHLAPYFPYKLKVYIFDDINFEKKYPNVNSRIEVTINNFEKLILKDKYKPILHPLSNITKEIEHNGEKFVPIKKLKTGGTDNENVYTIEDWDGTNYVCCDNENHELRFSAKSGFDRRYNCESRQIYAYDLFEKLFEWHFDVFGLIDKGLAIDKNTL